MATNYEQVCEFHELFGVPISPQVLPEIPEWRKKLRLGLIDEEYREVKDAAAEGDVAHLAKELCDLLYVVYGMGIEYGLPMDECFAEVHRSNMTKLGPGGRPVVRQSDGKVLKGPNYREANFRSILTPGHTGVISAPSARSREL